MKQNGADEGMLLELGGRTSLLGVSVVIVGVCVVFNLALNSTKLHSLASNPGSFSGSQSRFGNLAIHK